MHRRKGGYEHSIIGWFLNKKKDFLRFIESDIITKETVKQRVHMATENIFENFKYENDRGASAKNEHRFEDDEFEFLFLDIDKIVMK